MKLHVRVLALMLAFCLLPYAALAAEAQGVRLLEIPEETDQPSVTIAFEGEAGVSYTLHYRYRNIWLLPETQTLTDGTRGEFVVDLGEGQNDFVLAEEGQPRDAEGVVTFSIRYTPAGTAASPEPTEAPLQTLPPETEAPSPEPTETPTPEPTQAMTLAPAPTPEATPELTPTPEPTPEPEPAGPVDRIIGLWMEGDDVLALQEGLTALKFRYGSTDGVYGPRTRAAVMRFQRKNGIKVDGLVGAQTREALEAQGVTLPPYVAPDMTRPDGFDRDLSNGKTGMDVYALQEALQALGYLNRAPDQVYGRRTRTAVRAFQRDNGLKVDGVAGPETLRLLIDGNPAPRATAIPEPGALETPLPTDAPAPEETEVPEATPTPENTEG